MAKISVFFLAFGLTLSACSHAPPRLAADPKLRIEGEKNLANLRRLTADGTNAEAYFSGDGARLVFQRQVAAPAGAPEGAPVCDQIFTMKTDGTELKRISNGPGRTTCGFFIPRSERVLYSQEATCPAKPDASLGYTWPVDADLRLVSSRADGKAEDAAPLEPAAPRAYHAETTVCKDGSAVFTSDRDGDLELYRGRLDPKGALTEIKRLTQAVGYDGGAFFSPDCKRIVWRASRPRPGAETDDYRKLLKQHLVRPSRLELWTADADGGHARQLTRLGAASFAPTFAPDGRHVVFSANLREKSKFDLYRIRVDGTHLERVTFGEGFDGFPMFSPDGTTLAFSSNRLVTNPGEMHVVLADWVETPERATVDVDARAENAADRAAAIAARLSAPEMEGRGVGTAGLGLAETYVAERMKALGLRPFRAEGYLHPAEMLVATSGTEKKTLTAHNVVGAWSAGARDCEGGTPAVLLGAHLDHLGRGADGSLETSQKGLHPGADDNASGVAGLLEAARLLIEAKKPGCFVFAAFTGEEIGIAGSARFAEFLADKKVRLKAMLNLDMIGRLENGQLIVYGTESATEWPALVAETCAHAGLGCPGGGDGYGPSDQMAFYQKGAPVLHLFTGPHADYHRVSDTADKLNATGIVQVAEVTAELAARVAGRRQTLHFRKAAAAPTMGKLAGTGGDGAAKGARPYLGTIPDYASLTSPRGPGGAGADAGGVKLSGVREGSPAEKAGVQSGDILTAIETHRAPASGGETAQVRTIVTLEDFMAVLTGLQIEEDVVLHVKRNGALTKLNAKVGRRE